MIVTAVAAVNRQKCKVFLEEDFAFILYKSEAERFHIEEGQELSGKVYEQIEQEILLPRARNKALDLLTVQARSRQQLRAKLAQFGNGNHVAVCQCQRRDNHQNTEQKCYFSHCVFSHVITSGQYNISVFFNH